MENKSLSERMAQILNGLSEEQKEKVRACKDPKELVALLSDMGVELPDELLDGVAGGVIYRVHEHIYRNQTEVIGKVLGYIVADDDNNDENVETTTLADAEWMADKLNWKKDIIDI